MSTRLKSCPFCGHEPAMGAIATNEAPDKWQDVVGCFNPRCFVRPEAVASSMSLALRRWNRRKPLAELKP